MNFASLKRHEVTAEVRANNLLIEQLQDGRVRLHYPGEEPAVVSMAAFMEWLLVEPVVGEA